MAGLKSLLSKKITGVPCWTKRVTTALSMGTFPTITTLPINLAGTLRGAFPGSVTSTEGPSLLTEIPFFSSR